MRYILILILASMIAVLSCSPAPRAGENGDELQTEALTTDSSGESGSYEAGTWIQDWDKAIAAARKMQRPILVNFTGSDWCVWCFRLRDEVFSQENFQDYASKNLILLELDFPRKIAQSGAIRRQNANLQKQFGIQGFPTIILLNPEGKEINRTGYQKGGAANYVKHLQDLLN
jgi:protein disulfide-isomerase